MEPALNEPPFITGEGVKLDYDVMREWGMSPNEWYSYDTDEKAMMQAHYILCNAIKAVSAFEQRQENERNRLAKEARNTAKRR